MGKEDNNATYNSEYHLLIQQLWDLHFKRWCAFLSKNFNFNMHRNQFPFFTLFWIDIMCPCSIVIWRMFSIVRAQNYYDHPILFWLAEIWQVYMKQFLPRQNFSSNFFHTEKVNVSRSTTMPWWCIPRKVNKTNRAVFQEKWSSNMKRVYETSAQEIQTRDCNLKL